jgi:hypothetical protein
MSGLLKKLISLTQADFQTKILVSLSVKIFEQSNMFRIKRPLSYLSPKRRENYWQ